MLEPSRSTKTWGRHKRRGEGRRLGWEMESCRASHHKFGGEMSEPRAAGAPAQKQTQSRAPNPYTPSTRQDFCQLLGMGWSRIEQNRAEQM